MIISILTDYMGLKLFVCLVVALFSDGNYISAGNTRRVPEAVTAHKNWKLLDRRDICGRTLSPSGYRIVGGARADAGEYPWMARLGYSSFSNTGTPHLDEFRCGGSVINERYILTAAHCAPEYQDADLILVRLGGQDTESAPPARDYAVQDIICHPGYTEQKKQHDICLVRVEPIQFNEFVRPVCLPFYEHLQNRTFVDEHMKVAGWGRIDPDSDKVSESLLVVSVPVVDQSICREFFSKKNLVIGDVQLCAGGEEGKDSCGGDSGGPLIKSLLLDYDLLSFQFGIVSFGAQKCAQENTPAIYTRVDKYLKWILDNVHD